jgi:monofunctional biosynthetic peptidoglycan transglycosylase
MGLRALARGLLVLAAAAGAGLLQAGLRRAAPAPALLGGALLLALLPAALVAALRWARPPTSAFMLRARAARRRLPPERRAVAHEWVPLDRISGAMCLAAVAAEDAYFRHHAGFDWESIRAAREHNRTHETPRGASTITQQLAKNLFLWPARSYPRKALETCLAALLEALLPKRRILELYLNLAQLGDGVFGVQAAARRYFGKPAAELTPPEAALLAAALPNPVRHRVPRPSHELRLRQMMVLSAMTRLDPDYLARL